ncbi:alpha/beta hydrolase family protein [mine drainage metagenome]|uniref:Alpha/beta hydrolase family protein n=1 Tax=mine drainage metagenome TaxID=410659 RepID=A0A1J5RZ05_9ZZZZ
MQDVQVSPVTLIAADGCRLAARHWTHTTLATRAVVVINPATAVKASYYHRYAQFLAMNGMSALTYDYRGIGESRRGSLRQIKKVSKLDWGRLDCDAALQWARNNCIDVPVHVVAHSIGGLLIGLAKNNTCVERCVTVGAQYAYWRDYERSKRLSMWLRWHLLMPVLTTLFGYFPAKALGWHEDLPAAAAYEWAFRPARLEESYPGASEFEPDALSHFAGMTGDILAIGMTDDPFATQAAVDRLLAYFVNSRRVHVRLSPESIGEESIGHFAFFHDRFKATLWQQSLDWLISGIIPESAVSTAITPAVSSNIRMPADGR